MANNPDFRSKLFFIGIILMAIVSCDKRGEHSISNSLLENIKLDALQEIDSNSSLTHQMF